MKKLVALPLPHPRRHALAFLVKTDSNEKVGEMRYDRTGPNEDYTAILVTAEGELVSFGTTRIATSQHAMKCAQTYCDGQQEKAPNSPS